MLPGDPTAPPPVTQTLPTPTAVNSTADSAAEELPNAHQAALHPSARGDLDLLPGIPRYEINLVVDFDKGAFQGNSKVKVTNKESVPLERLFFRLLPNAQKSYGNGWLEVTRTKVGGQEVSPPPSTDDTVLEVPLPEPLPAGGSVTVELDFQGQAAVNFGGEDDPVGYGIYNLSDNVLALSGWYPILAVYDADGWNLDAVSAIGDSVYSDTGLYSVEITVPRQVVIASTGVQAASVDQGAQRLDTYLSGPARDFFLVMSPDYAVFENEVEGTRVKSYFLPGDEQAAQIALDVASDSLEVFNQRFGQYPYLEMDVVEAPMQYALGVEYPGVFLVSADLYAEPQDARFIVTIAHEVAHQWWYALVGNDVFANPWLDEGLATYSSSLYFEETGGRRAYQGFTGYLQERYQELRADGQDDVITESLEYFERLNQPRIYAGVVYTKAALFFEALREEIGDQAFFDGLQSYYQDNKYGIAQPADLLESFETASGEQLDAFYEKWLYQAQD